MNNIVFILEPRRQNILQGNFPKFKPKLELPVDVKTDVKKKKTMRRCRKNYINLENQFVKEAWIEMWKEET